MHANGWLKHRNGNLRQLEASQEWQSLAEADRERMLYQNALGPVAQLTIGTDEELLANLDATPLAAWEDKIAAPQGRVKKVREETAKLLSPRVVRIPIPQVTLKSVEEVDDYLAMLRVEMMKQIEAGKSGNDMTWKGWRESLWHRYQMTYGTCLSGRLSKHAK